MATLRTSTSKRTGATLYRVEWRLGGTRDGDTQSESFGTDVGAANIFKAHVEAAGHQWPANYVPGLGFVDPRDMPAPEPDTITLGQLAKRWLDSRSGVGPHGVSDYTSAIRHHILNHFGDDTDINDRQLLSRETVAAWIKLMEWGERDPDDEKAWKVRPCAPASISRYHWMLSSILRFAQEMDTPLLHGANPAKGAQLPRVDGFLRTSDDEDDDVLEDVVFLSTDEFQTLHDAAPEAVRSLLAIMVGTGLRWSEASALKVKDIKLSGRVAYLTVRRAWKRQYSGPPRLGEPKSAASRRTVSLTTRQADMLRPLITRRRPDEFVFTTPRGLPWRHGNFTEWYWRRTLYKATRCETHRAQDRAAGLVNLNMVRRKHIVWCGCEDRLREAPRIHDLRHTHASWLILAGRQTRAIQRRLGHESITTTERYMHVLPEVEDGMVEAIDELLSGLDLATASGDPSAD